MSSNRETVWRGQSLITEDVINLDTGKIEVGLCSLPWTWRASWNLTWNCSLKTSNYLRTEPCVRLLEDAFSYTKKIGKNAKLTQLWCWRRPCCQDSKLKIARPLSEWDGSEWVIHTNTTHFKDGEWAHLTQGYGILFCSEHLVHKYVCGLLTSAPS